MYNRIYKFLDKTSIIYSIHFGFRQHYSISYALLNLTESIMKALDDGNFACGIFVDLYQAFETVDQSILLNKLRYWNSWINKQMV